MRPIRLVADAGPLIALARIDHLGLLSRICREVVIPPEVAGECLRDATLPGSRAIAAAIEQGKIVVAEAPNDQHLGFPSVLGDGERAAIRLAVALRRPILLDDRRARDLARKVGASVVGTGGLLLEAKARGGIEQVEPILRRLLESGYHLSAGLIAELLRRAGEHG